MHERDHRRALIRRLLQEHDVGSQEELLAFLEAQGVTATQATLSRDLRDMGVVREQGASGPRYRLDPRNRGLDMIRQVVGMEIQSVRHNGSMVVVRTLTGRAEGVAGFLDSWGNTDLLGSVAGDDTVFVAPVALDRTEALASAIRGLCGGAGPTLREDASDGGSDG